MLRRTTASKLQRSQKSRQKMQMSQIWLPEPTAVATTTTQLPSTLLPQTTAPLPQIPLIKPLLLSILIIHILPALLVELKTIDS